MSSIGTAKNHNNIVPSERLLTAAAGAALLYFGVKGRSTLRSGALAVLGGYLLNRGATGYCAVYDALNLDSNKAREKLSSALSAPMTAHVDKILTIHRPVDEVHEFLGKPAGFSRFVGPLERIERLPDGYQRWFFRTIGGLGLHCDVEVTDDRENKNLISWRSRVRSSLIQQGFLSLRRGNTEAETEVRISMTYALPIGRVGRIAAWALTPIIEQLVGDSLRQLRQLIEDRDLPVAAKTGRKDVTVTSTNVAAEPKELTDDFEGRYRQTTDAHGKILH